MSEPISDLEAEVEGLYAEDPAAFVAGRDALVRRLRTQKRRDDALAIKKLTRPAVAAWSLDRAACSHPRLIDELAAAGRGLREAQTEAFGSGSGAGAALRDALAARRAVVRSLVEVAADVAQQHGAGDVPTLRSLWGPALETISLDVDLLGRLRRGVLVALPAPSSGLDMFLAAAPASFEAATPVQDITAGSRARSAGRARARDAVKGGSAEEHTKADRPGADATPAPASAARVESAQVEAAQVIAARTAARARVEAAGRAIAQADLVVDGLRAEAEDLARRITEAEKSRAHAAAELARATADVDGVR